MGSTDSRLRSAQGRLRRHRLAAGAVALVLCGAIASVVLLTSDELEKVCTLIGGRSGVAFDLGQAGLARGDSVVLCVDHRCRRLRWTGGRHRLFIDTRANGPRRVPVVVVVERQGKRAVVRSGRVRLERSEPNGPGCGTWWNTDTTVAELRVPDTIR